MQYFTRQLHAAMQDPKRREEAFLEWRKRIESYGRHFDTIEAKLPESACQFARHSFHDAELLETHFGKNQMSFLLSLRSCFSDFTQPYARLTFVGVREHSSKLPRQKEDWLYDELHLDDGSAFRLHVFFENTDFRIAAEDIDIQLLPEI